LLNASSIYTGPCSDLTGDQIVPIDLLGTEYIAMNGELNGPGDQLFVTALNNGTQIFRDGNATPLATINANATVRIPVVATAGQIATFIRATGPVAVWHLTGVGCEMGATQLPQIECSGSSSVYYTRTLAFDLYLNLMVQAGGQNNFTINGTPLTGATWTPVPGTANQWFSTRINFTTTQVPPGSVLTVTNSTHLFHMSVLDGNGGNGTSYSYFSNYNSVRAIASAGSNNLCEGDTIKLFARTAPGATYSWTGPTGFNSIQQNPTIPNSAGKTGWYYLTVSSVSGSCGSSTDSVFVTVHRRPAADLGPDVSVCVDSFQLRAPVSANTTVRGNNRDIIQACGIRLDDPIVSLGSDTTVCEETPLELQPHVLHSDRLLWSDGSAGSSLSVRYGGVYSVTALNECGAAYDTVEVRQIFCEIWVPNVFTPNGDGKNDVFRVVGNVGRMNQFNLSIFDRWGQRVFYTSDKYQGWDGYYKGVPCILGTYVYMLEYQIDGIPMLEKGNFHLIR
jgi:gliding motility-associated-like protein